MAGVFCVIIVNKKHFLYLRSINVKSYILNIYYGRKIDEKSCR